MALGNIVSSALPRQKLTVGEKRNSFDGGI